MKERRIVCGDVICATDWRGDDGTRLRRCAGSPYCRRRHSCIIQPETSYISEPACTPRCIRGWVRASEDEWRRIEHVLSSDMQKSNIGHTRRERDRERLTDRDSQTDRQTDRARHTGCAVTGECGPAEGQGHASVQCHLFDISSTLARHARHYSPTSLSVCE